MHYALVPSCRLCGATSYRRVISRDADGRMVASGLYQCSGCSAVFADPKAWREGGDELPPKAGPVRPLTPVASDLRDATAQQGRTVSTGPGLATYGMVPGCAHRDSESGR